MTWPKSGLLEISTRYDRAPGRGAQRSCNPRPAALVCTSAGARSVRVKVRADEYGPGVVPKAFGNSPRTDQRNTPRPAMSPATHAGEGIFVKSLVEPSGRTA